MRTYHGIKMGVVAITEPPLPYQMISPGWTSSVFVECDTPLEVNQWYVGTLYINTTGIAFFTVTEGV